MSSKNQAVEILRISGPGFMFDDPSACTVVFRGDGRWIRESIDLQELIRERNQLEAALEHANNMLDDVHTLLTRDDTTLDDIRRILEETP